MIKAEKYYKYAIIYSILLLVFFINTRISLFLFSRNNDIVSIGMGFYLKCGVIISIFTVALILIDKFIVKEDSIHLKLEAIGANRGIIVLIIVTICLVFSINGYSLSSWDRFLNDDDSINIVYGLKRDITSDAWALGLPAIVNQVENDFPTKNFDVMSTGANSNLMGLPTKDITMIGKPFLWGYLSGNVNFGVSWNYVIKLALLFLSSYEIFKFLTKNNEVLSLIFSVLLSFSSGIQWWFSHNIIDIIILFQLSIAAVLLFIEHQHNQFRKILFGLIFCIGGSGFIITLYPALQVPLGYLFIIIFLMIVDQKKEDFDFKKTDYLLIGMVITFTLFVAWRYYDITKDSLVMITQTAYPGKRISIGGDYSFERLYYHFMQMFLPFKNTVFLNNCEVSSIASYLPSVVLLFPFLYKFKKEKMILILFSYEIFLLMWLFFEFPVSFAKNTLFSYVTGGRLMIVIGLISVYLMSILFANKEIKKMKWVHTHLIVSFMGVLVGILILLGSHNYISSNRILNISVYFLVVIFHMLLTYLICRRNIKGGLLLLLVYTIISGMTINPIAFGTSSLLSSDLSNAIHDIDLIDDEAYWLIDDEFPYSNYLLAQGVKAFNTLNSYPDYNKWRILDPEGKYEDVYNRYAHVSVKVIDQGCSFSLLAPDSILVEIDPTYIRSMNIKFIMSGRKLEQYGFEKVYEDNYTDFSIYQVE